MIRHVAIFRFAPKVSEEEAAALMNGFRALGDQIPQLQDLHAGPNISPEQLDQGFRHGIIADFRTAEDFEAYLKHPLHVTHAQNVIAALRTGLKEDVIVFDLTV
jgi:hypothetical protein